MKLHEIPTREFVIKDRETGISHTITAAWVGAPGHNQRQFLVPVRAHDRQDQEHLEPDPARWGITPTASFRPQIRANVDDSAGMILRLSAAGTGRGRAVGRILVSEETVDNVLVLVLGVAGNENGGLWEEAILVVRGEAELYLQTTSLPDQAITVSEDGVHCAPAQGLPEDMQYFRLVDSRVEKWDRKEQQARSARAESRTDNPSRYPVGTGNTRPGAI